MPPKPLILVLCTGNSCRSQMAEGFLRKCKGDRFIIDSAGTDPKPQVHPLAVRVMQEIGVDISAHRPKNLSEFHDRADLRHVLIVCDHANKTCPRSWTGNFARTFMPFDDPAAFVGSGDETLMEFRRVREEIAEAMRNWNPAVESERR